MTQYKQRFGGIERLYGKDQAAILARSHIAVFGIGGVGSWVAEALARSGIGRITLVDMDEVCITNTNRQVHAESSTVGQMKTAAMTRRILSIHPECEIVEENRFFTPSSCDELLAKDFSCVVDAIDDRKNKCLLIAQCKRRKIPMVTIGGAGGRKDPTQVRINDITSTTNDRLISRVRSKLRQDYGFSRNTKRSWGIPCVYSVEPITYPDVDGSVCLKRPLNTELKLDCESGYGTASFLTGTMGFNAAAKAIELVLRKATANHADEASSQ
jgi:tRNA threonylcarbamoyladenosine dehydratase